MTSFTAKHTHTKSGLSNWYRPRTNMSSKLTQCDLHCTSFLFPRFICGIRVTLIFDITFKFKLTCRQTCSVLYGCYFKETQWTNKKNLQSERVVFGCLCTTHTQFTKQTAHFHACLQYVRSERQFEKGQTEELFSDHMTTSFTAVNETQNQILVVIGASAGLNMVEILACLRACCMF